MTTTWDVKTDFATEDLALELDRVEDLRQQYEHRLTDLALSGADWRPTKGLVELAEDRGTEIWTELNRRGWFDR